MGIGTLLQAATSKIGLTIIGAFLAYQSYLMIRPSEPVLDPARAEAADRVAAEAVRMLRQAGGENWTGKYVSVARFSGDPSDAVRDRIEALLPAATNCRLVTDTLLRELRDSIAAKAGRLGVIDAVTADRWRGGPVTCPSQALKLARDEALDYVVTGAVRDLRNEDGRGQAELAIQLVDKAHRGIVLSETLSSELSADAVYAQLDGAGLRDDARDTLLRLGGWMLAVMLLPLATQRLWRIILEHESLPANIAVLLLLTLADAALFHWLLGADFSALATLTLCALAAAAALVYNLIVLNLLDDAVEQERCALV